MHQASVGFQCPECARAGRQRVVRGVRPAAAHRAVVTTVLVVVNLAVFLVGIGSGLETRDAVTVDGGLIASGRTGFDTFIGVAHGEWWRIFTSGFLHANLIHVGFNCLLLYQLGSLLEPALGRLRFGLVYLTALVSGALGVLLLDPSSLTVGASGAVFGLLGASFVTLRARGIDPFATGVGGVLVLNLLFTFAIPGISVGGHLGGLVGGAVVGYVFAEVEPRRRLEPWAAPALVLALASAAFGVALVIA